MGAWPPQGDGGQQWGPPPGAPAQPGPAPGAWSYQPPAAEPDRTDPATGLRPLTLSDVLDGMFRLLVTNVRTYVLVLGVLLLPVNVVSSYLQHRSMGGRGLFAVLSDPEMLETMGTGPLGTAGLIAQVVTAVVALVVTPLSFGLAAAIAARAHLGQDMTPGEIWRQVGRRYLTLVVAAFLFFLLVLAPILPGLGVAIAGAAGGSAGLGLVGVLLVMIGLLGSLTVGFVFSLFPVAIVTERLGPVAGLARSARLVRRRFWPFVGVLLVCGLIYNVVSSIIALGLTLPGTLVSGTAGFVLTAAGAVISGVLITPILVNALVLLYFDLRVRTEGLDLQLAAAAIGAPPEGPAQGAWTG